MLYRQHLSSALKEQREAFARFERTRAAELADYARRLRELGNRTSEEIKRRCAEAAKKPGALPSAELERAGGIAWPFARQWRSHEAARQWALETLIERVTFAVDGSQILPGREISLPVAAVQVASFENPHARDGNGYRKEAHFDLVTPEELLETHGGQLTADAIVGLRRFELETRALCEFLERRGGWQERGERAPVAFFDGTLLLSSAQIRTEGNFPRAFVEAIAEVVNLSRETRVPVVGFIDQSYARDLVSLLDALEGGARPPTSLYDAQLLCASTNEHAPLLAAWGDRTIFCSCQREGLTKDFLDERSAPLVGFVYLQTTEHGAPARLDVPAWIYEANLLDEVIDAVRAECVVGNGYPYAVETADAAAVITSQDRQQFLRAMQQFAAEQKLGFNVSRKAVSKNRRR